MTAKSQRGVVLRAAVEAEVARAHDVIQRWFARLSGYRKWSAAAAGVLLVTFGLVVAYGWVAQVPALVQPHPEWSSMKFNTALCFITLGVGLLALIFGARGAALACAVLVAVVAALVLMQHAFGVDLSIDELFVSDYLTPPEQEPGRLSPMSAILLMVGSWVLVLLWSGYAVWRTALAGILASLIAGVALSALMGYVARAPASTMLTIPGIPVLGALAFIVFGVGCGAYAATLETDHLPRWLPWAALIAGFACTFSLGAALLPALGRQSRVPELVIAVGATLSILMAVSLQAYRRLDAQGVLVRRALAKREEALRASELAEHRLRDSLQEKELLLKEIHHRVKNNLQVVASLLALQAARSRDPQSREMLEDCRQRVLSMAMVHQKLYGASDLQRIDLGTLVRDIAGMLVGSQDRAAIEVLFDLEPLVVDIETAFPASLIANELITNCLKHAFVGRDHGIMRIVTRREPHGRGRIVVSDDGIGGVTSETFTPGGSLGSTIVRALVRQLDGELSVGENASGGSAIAVVFPVSRARP